MNGVANARARRVNAGKGDGFQKAISYKGKNRKALRASNEKPPAALAGGGL
jgi:hypothetical protein